jgi:hypothetical protein
MDEIQPLRLESMSRSLSSRREALRSLTFLPFTLAAAPALSVDVVVYGASPAGLAAAAAVRRQGATVAVIEPTTQIGGLVTGGIARTDTATPHFVGGLAAEFFNSALAENRRLYPQPVKPVLRFRGKTLDWRPPRPWDLEPKLASQLFNGWVRQGGYPLLRNRRVSAVRLAEGSISSIRLTDGTTLSAKVFIDASYEGDLMAKSGVPYTWGRESREEYGESLAGVRTPHFTGNYSVDFYNQPGNEYTHHGQFGADIPARDGRGKLLWGVSGEPLAPLGSADRRIQAYCFRLVATQREDLRVPWPKPRRYHPQNYDLLLRYIEAHPGISFGRLVHFAAIPNGKFDLNASGPFSIDYIGANFAFPDGSYALRQRIYQDHLDYQQGFLWFLAHDARVPAELRQEVNSWGLCRDEYPDTNHWPVQLYIRESRRLLGEYVMTEKDILKNNRKDDSVGMGSFVLDSHWVQRYANEKGFVRVEGHLDESIRLENAPYEISYRSLTPRKQDCRNLLVPVCLSASHVAMCTIRMEPVYMMMGEAAGLAAALAARSGAAVQDLDSRLLLSTLRRYEGVLRREDARVSPAL